MKPAKARQLVEQFRTLLIQAYQLDLMALSKEGNAIQLAEGMLPVLRNNPNLRNFGDTPVQVALDELARTGIKQQRVAKALQVLHAMSKHGKQAVVIIDDPLVDETPDTQADLMEQARIAESRGQRWSTHRLANVRRQRLKRMRFVRGVG